MKEKCEKCGQKGDLFDVYITIKGFDAPYMKQLCNNCVNKLKKIKEE